MTKLNAVNIIGGGLAGSEAALYLSSHGIRVRLFEAKPLWLSAAHKSTGFAEIVCSNSLKSTVETTASGTLKNELDALGCSLLGIARETSVPAGSALAVDRDKFSARVTASIEASPNIEIINKIVDDIDTSELTLVCAGPVCHDSLANSLIRLSGENSLHFFDAAAPIITAECIDMSRAFYGARYGKGGDDYINCPMTKDEYLNFYRELIAAERATDEIGGVFEGCMPVEVMAARGEDALRFGPLRPVGFREAGKPYAVLQLRRENREGTLFNLVGFQTNLKFGEQKRVFSLIPALKNIEIVRYGVMHRNTFINAPVTLSSDLRLLRHENVFVAGQLCGVEGYVESIATGLLAAINARRLIQGKQTVVPPRETILGALCEYITTPNSNFQPMNANFGILPQLVGVKKAERKQAYYVRSAKAIGDFVQNTL
ncbi:MAG: methylenetetrahydrofolate--tRNA-(uracil(54)-C(5))-methyltransferase (FADH(2)-oxidizing) TrmFO [Clostridiales bacterium]|nr:methylenetetrahydrofolate--tRNA-(uracil(54)-C(5))-methyltransferase (FADH(2)-oxidizing) TrmFO [Clostridiales bacterium]